MSILIVEDNTISLRMLEVMLVSNGFDVTTAKTGRQALDRLSERDDVQLVVTDLMMPEMDGMQLLEEMRQNARFKDIPVLVVSSLSDAETVRRVVQLGCRNYLVKPLKEETLIPKLRTLLAGVSSATAARQGPLKAKFDVLRDNGLDVSQYDQLFDAFVAQAREALAGFERASTATPSDEFGRSLIALRDGTALLSTGAITPLLDAFRSSGTCDFAALREGLGDLVAAMDAAIEKRNRMRQKLEQGEASN